MRQHTDARDGVCCGIVAQHTVARHVDKSADVHIFGNPRTAGHSQRTGIRGSRCRTVRDRHPFGCRDELAAVGRREGEVGV